MDTYGFGEHKDKAMRTGGPMTINLRMRLIIAASLRPAAGNAPARGFNALPAFSVLRFFAGMD